MSKAHGSPGVRQSPARQWSLKRIQKDSNFIKVIQRYRTPMLDQLFRIAARFGDEIAYTLGLPIIGWSTPSNVTMLVILSWSLTFWLGHCLKDLFQLPRPHHIDSEVVCLENHFSAEFGLPSTHAQAVWAIPFTALFALGSSVPNRGAWIAFAIVYASTVSFSRLYLGVHSVLDVAVGTILGMLTCVASIWFGPSLIDAFLSLSPILAIFASFFAHSFLLAIYPALPGFSTTYRDTAAILGVASGIWSMRRLMPLIVDPLLLAGNESGI